MTINHIMLFSLVFFIVRSVSLFLGKKSIYLAYALKYFWFHKNYLYPFNGNILQNNKILLMPPK